MKNKRILITGAAGSIGSELVRQLCKDNKIYALDNNETGLFETITENKVSGRVGDIRDKDTVRDVFSDFKPQIVFHAAAYKHVPLMEEQHLEAINVNVVGLNNVLHFAKVYEVDKFVFISTDKAVDPDCVMGATKRLGEIMVKNSGYTAVRFGNVIGSRGSVTTIWDKQLENGQPLTITDRKMVRYFMTIQDACKLVVEAGDKGKGGELWILDMGKPKKVIDFMAIYIRNKYPDRYAVGYNVIGIRKGEKLIEKLMFEEEEKRAIKKGKFFIIK